MTIADKIKRAREQAGFSQQELADRLHVSRSAVAKWESGLGTPDIENLKGLSRLFGVSMDALTDDSIDTIECTLAEPMPPGCDPDDAVRTRWPDAVCIDRLLLEDDFGWPGRILNTLTFGWVRSIWQSVHYDECCKDRYYLVDTLDEHIFVRIHEGALFISPLGRRILRSERDSTFRHRGRTYMGAGKVRAPR